MEPDKTLFCLFPPLQPILACNGGMKQKQKNNNHVYTNKNDKR